MFKLTIDELEEIDQALRYDHDYLKTWKSLDELQEHLRYNRTLRDKIAKIIETAIFDKNVFKIEICPENSDV